MQGVSINYFIIILEFFANFTSDTNTFTLYYFTYFIMKKKKTIGLIVITILFSLHITHFKTQKLLTYSKFNLDTSIFKKKNICITNYSIEKICCINLKRKNLLLCVFSV